MTKLIRIPFIAALALAAGLPGTSPAAPPEPVSYQFYLPLVDMTAKLASGTYTATGLLAGNGAVIQEFRVTQENAKGGQTVHGTKLLMQLNAAGGLDTVEFEFNGLMAAAEPSVVVLPDGRRGLLVSSGKVRFVMQEGGGGFADVHGQGEGQVNLIMLLDTSGPAADANGQPQFVLTGTYEGQAHFAP